MNIVSKEIMSSKASNSVKNVHQIGEAQCIKITKERLKAVTSEPTSLYATKSKNNLTLSYFPVRLCQNPKTYS